MNVTPVADLVANGNGHHGRRRVNFDPTINLGHILTGSIFLISTVAAWVTMDARITAAEKDGKRIEAQASREVGKVEIQLIERIKINENALERFGLNYREDMRDIKALLARIEDKLDHKADKPGR